MTTRTRQPFVIVPKIVLSTIIERVDGTDAAFCCAVAVAIRWLANDAGTADEPIQATITQIAQRSGLRYTATSKAIGILEAIGVLRVERRKIAGTKANAPSGYSFPVIHATSRAMQATKPALPATHYEEPSPRTFPAESSAGRTESMKKEGKEPKEAEREPAPSNASLLLSDVECAAIAADVRATPESIRECLRVFNEVKAAWPNDPRTIEAFRGWVRTAKPARSILKPSAPTTAAGNGDEPTGWQAWIDAERPESIYAKGQSNHGTPWRNLDQATRNFIRDEMQRRPAA